MTVIDSYLDTLFAPYPDSPRLREARGELRAMMEDKQQDLLARGLSESQAVGQVIAEFGSLEEVAEDLGIAAELHGPRFGRGFEGAAGGERRAPAPLLDEGRAREYTRAVRSSRGFLALGVPLFVLSPIPLLLLLALSGRVVDEPDPWQVTIGLIILLVTVAIGVVLLMVRGARLRRFEDITEGRVTPSGAVHRYAASLREEHGRTRTVGIAVAICLWILCAIPVIVAGVASTGEEDVLPLYGVCVTLAIIALGLAIMLSTTWSEDVAATLTQEPDVDEDAPENSANPVVRVIASVYWPVVTAIFLGWSFLTGDWGTTWIVWPVAGVLYGALWGLSAALGGVEGGRGKAAWR